MSRVAGVVLAAGSGSRMGTPKGELVVAGERLVDRAVRVLRDGGCDQPVLAVVRPRVQVAQAAVVENPDPARGMRSSLALAVEAAAHADALVVILVDTPGVGAGAVRTVLAEWEPGRICVASYNGVRGHPTVMSPTLWRDALSLAAPDEGARVLLARRPDLVVVVPVEGTAEDLDTPADLARWEG